MGDTFQTVVDRDATPEDAPRLAGAVVDLLVAEGIVLARAEPGWALGDDPAHPPGPHWHKAVADARGGSPEGVAVYTRHRVFYSSFDDRWTAAVSCPRCRTGLRDTAPFSDPIDRWYRTGEADVECPACAATVPLEAWNWTEDHLAFVHLGLVFWNWPRLADEFRARLVRLLGGHRTAYLPGKV
ncbi:hypothetical protein [Streptomyces sp. NPDC058291]|jgi:hypothetical protein|uniref:hypothetical protein n=1 Tax=Streptomyces sp. NPDC058291 TaxID=3346427 RepID=UPI0036E5D078